MYFTTRYLCSEMGIGASFNEMVVWAKQIVSTVGKREFDSYLIPYVKII